MHPHVCELLQNESSSSHRAWIELCLPAVVSLSGWDDRCSPMRCSCLARGQQFYPNDSFLELRAGVLSKPLFSTGVTRMTSLLWLGQMYGVQSCDWPNVDLAQPRHFLPLPQEIWYFLKSILFNFDIEIYQNSPCGDRGIRIVPP